MGRWQYKPGRYGNLPIDRGLGVTNSRTAPGGNPLPQGHGDQRRSARLGSRRGHLDRQRPTHQPGGRRHRAMGLRRIGGLRDGGQHRPGPPQARLLPPQLHPADLQGQGPGRDQLPIQRAIRVRRFTHRAAVNYEDRHYDYPTVRFELDAGGTPTQANSGGNVGHKGAHDRLVLRGFIPKFDRGAKRFEFAKDWEFDFVVTRSLAGLVNDEAYHARQLISWSDQIVKSVQDSFATRGTTGFVDDLAVINSLTHGQLDEIDFQAAMGFGQVPKVKADDPTRGHGS
jgi:hypothetical protein